MQGRKDDQAKPRMDLVSSHALLGLGAVLHYGAEKYDAHNWRGGMEWSRLTGAAMRHLLAFQGGEDIDPESGLPHIDHALCCLMFLSEFQKTGCGTDNRYQEMPGKAEKIITEISAVRGPNPLYGSDEVPF